jgi:hypothetical protein
VRIIVVHVCLLFFFLIVFEISLQGFNSTLSTKDQTNNTEQDDKETKDQFEEVLVAPASQFEIEKDGENQDQCTVTEGTQERQKVTKEGDENSNDSNDNN